MGAPSGAASTIFFLAFILNECQLFKEKTASPRSKFLSLMTDLTSELIYCSEKQTQKLLPFEKRQIYMEVYQFTLITS